MNIFIDICIVVAIFMTLLLFEIFIIRSWGKKAESNKVATGATVLFMGINCLIIGILSCLLLLTNGYLPQ